MTLKEVNSLTKWIPSWHDDVMCMDKRHILTLKEIAYRCDIKSAAEIGVHTAVSSSAFIEAGIGEQTTFIDIRITKEARQLLKGLSFAQMKGSEWIKRNDLPNLLFIDGSHSVSAVKEEIEAIETKQIPNQFILCGHDPNATKAGYGECEGAELLLDWSFSNFAHVYVDYLEREGEKTQRGFFAATNDDGYASKLDEIFNEICDGYDI